MSILKCKEMFKSLMGQNDSPSRIAVSFGVGTVIGMSPLLGLHTLLGVFISWAFKLNKPATIAGVYVTNPFTIVPIYTFGTWVGIKLMGMDLSMLGLDFKGLTLSNVMRELGAFLIPFIVGETVAALFGGVLGYFIMLYIFRFRHRKKPSETMA